MVIYNINITHGAIFRHFNIVEKDSGKCIAKIVPILTKKRSPTKVYTR
jgi:hypothetical protein